MPIDPRPDHLLEFKERAVYHDGRETPLSGAEAYALYGIEVGKILDQIGARTCSIRRGRRDRLMGRAGVR